MNLPIEAAEEDIPLSEKLMKFFPGIKHFFRRAAAAAEMAKRGRKVKRPLGNSFSRLLTVHVCLYIQLLHLLQFVSRVHGHWPIFTQRPT